MKHLKALLILLAHLLLLVLGTPGLDFQKWRQQLEPELQTQQREELGEAFVVAAVAVARFNGAVRQPLYDLVAPVQRPFRVRQSWHLYRDGPSRIHRLEIRVDDRLVHRTGDPEHAWRQAQLRNRRLRPIFANVVMKTGTPNWRGALRWVVQEVRVDFPQARQVELRATRIRFPGTRRLGEQVEVHHRYLARAPAWEGQELVEEGP